MPKLSVKHQSSKISNKLEFSTLPRNLAKLLLYAVPSIRQGWFFGMERRKFILFLSVGKSGKGNALFVFFVRNALGKKQNVHFPLRWAFLFIFFVTQEELNFQTEECSLQTQEYKLQTLQYKLQTRKYKLQRQEYNFQLCQYNLQTEEYKKILTEYSVRIQEYKNRTL